MFEFLEKKKDTTEEESTKGVWGSQLASAMSDARSRGVGKKKGTQKDGESNQGPSGGSGLSFAAEQKVRAMFEPDAWRAIVRAPFSLGKAVTGRACWGLEKTQEDTLATSTSATAEYFLQTDPKWIVLTLFCFNWSVILTEKFALNSKERQAEEKLNPPKGVPGINLVKS